MINTKCPYCGSDDMTADIDVRITGDLLEDGRIIARHYWTPLELTEESIAGASSQDIQGFCSNCGKYCSFDWEKGFIPGPGIDGEEPK